MPDPLLNGKARTVEREHDPRCQGEEQSNVQAAWTQPHIQDREEAHREDANSEP